MENRITVQVKNVYGKKNIYIRYARMLGSSLGLPEESKLIRSLEIFTR